MPRELRHTIGSLIRRGEIHPEELAPLVKTVKRTRRTLRNWARWSDREPSARPGRPRTPEEELAEARALVREQLDLQGWDTGEGPIWRGLDGAIPVARVRRVLAELKAARRKRIRQEALERRVSVSVQARDVIWSMDATHLGRLTVGMAVQGEVVRDVASTRTILLSVGLQASARDVVRLLEQACKERGGPPLVLQTDNGPAYIARRVRRWCKKRKVLRLLNLPHTPQHNGAVEHGMRELKLNAALGKGACLPNIEEAALRIFDSRDRLDANRKRRTRGWKTAIEADQDLPHWSQEVGRLEVYKKATCARRRAVLNCDNKRARRRAAREAILGTLEHFNLIQRTRGGLPWTAQ